jgi:hypothetical protein
LISKQSRFKDKKKDKKGNWDLKGDERNLRRREEKGKQFRL